ncbi:hypothetical protein FACS189434_00740 [Bacteroidia bacterium]|nr:hypothetical protein FACS189434_00740 [Bacteroidia bacterium]
MKRIILILSTLIACAAVAQNTALRVSAPATVAVGVPFDVAFSIDADAKDLRLDNFDGFDVLMGPSTAKSSSISISGNGIRQSVTSAFSYVLQARKEGIFTIPAATVMVGNKKYTSKPLEITVAAAQNQQNTYSSPSQSSIQTIGGVDVFIKAIPSKTTAYEQEAVLLTYKLYIRGVAEIFKLGESKYPDAKDFLTQEIQLPNNKQWSDETYNGKMYSTVILEQKLLYPQKAGSLQVGTGEYESQMRIINSAANGISDRYITGFQDVTRKIAVPAVKINVKPLPAGKPKSFDNAVGNFTLKSGISDTKVKENEAITLTLSIEGNGNLRSIKNPEIRFPNKFEVYDAKINAKLKNTTAGVSGTKSIEYLAIPRDTTGVFSIPATEFSYFEPSSQSYKTLKTNAYQITVEKGDGTASGNMQNFANKQNVKMLGSDIQFINTADTALQPKNNFIFGTSLFIFCYLIPLLLAIVLFIIFRKQAKENADIALTRTKKANQTATKRLKTAHKYLQENDKEKFYDEILKALWGYFGDKFSIPVADLTKENIEMELSNTGANETLIADFKNILSTCEYARYAPAAQDDERGELYHLTVEKISELEQMIKK